MNTFFAGILITSAALFAYHHFMYPLLVAVFAEMKRKRRSPTETWSSPALPTVTILVPVHNEEKVIADKIRNLTATDYPEDMLSIVIVLDGCNDGTLSAIEHTLAELLQNPVAARAVALMRIVEYPVNVGKVAVLNQQIAHITSDIVVLSDASAALEPDAIRRAVRHFSDQKIGVVAPTYKLVRAGSEGERAYTDYLTSLRRNEAELDSPLGCHGACYLFRRALWQQLPADTINDDFILPMQIIAAGFRGVYDTSIVSHELETTSRHQEFRRRVRLGAGNMQQSIRLARLLDPRRPWLAFMFASGKGLRPFMPIVAIIGIAAAAGLALNGVLVIQMMFLAVSIASLAIAVMFQSRPRIVTWLVYLIEGYAASLVGAVKLLAGQKLGYWQPNDPQLARVISANVIWPKQ